MPVFTFSEKTMQESKEIAPHITTKEELDALYKKKQNPEEEEKEKQKGSE